MRLPDAPHAVPHAAVALGRALRERGLAAGVDQEIVLCRALGELDMRRRTHVYWAARAAFVRSPGELPAFELAFERFWEGLDPQPPEPRAEHGESDPRVPGPQHGGQSLPQFRNLSGESRLVDGDGARAAQELPRAASEERHARDRRERRGVLAAWSPDEVLNEPEPLSYAAEELAAVRRLAEELRATLPLRRARRRKPSRGHGSLDLRRTLRRSLATGGEALHPARWSHSRRPRRLLVVCDVSGSMDGFSRALLAGLQGVVGAGARAETFVFATRLTRLTAPLSSRDAAIALERARADVADWSGGTRIGAALAELNRDWARRGVARGAIVVIVSDGWDRGDPDLLARELARLRLQARRLVWLNPRPADLGGQPLATGMRAALPHVDDYVPGHDPRALGQLGTILAAVGGARPPRSQRPPGAGYTRPVR